jgi:hypothetical protein
MLSEYLLEKGTLHNECFPTRPHSAVEVKAFKAAYIESINPKLNFYEHNKCVANFFVLCSYTLHEFVF